MIQPLGNSYRNYKMHLLFQPELCRQEFIPYIFLNTNKNLCQLFALFGITKQSRKTSAPE